MPGFNITGQEVGGQAQNPNSVMEVRRAHRWYFASLGLLTNQQVLLVLKTASRPSFSFEEPEMHHNQEQIYFAGKQTWESISMSWYDTEQPTDCSDAMWTWLNTVSDIATVCVASPTKYKAKTATLQMSDGCGNNSETWTMYNGWPQMVNWKELDYSSTELQLIEAKFRYDRAIKSPSSGT